MRVRRGLRVVAAIGVVAACKGQAEERGEARTDVTPPSCAVGGPGLADCGETATISSFRLDKYDVTVGRFRRFVAAWNAGWTPSPGSGKHARLDGGKGLATGGTDAGPGFEPGWMGSDDANVAPTDTNLACGGGSAT